MFVHWDEGRPHHPVSKHWISSGFTEAIHSAYRHLGREHERHRANPHSIQGMASSWAEIARVPAKESCRVATWLDTYTFAQFYWLGYSGSHFASAILKTAALAQLGQSNPETQFLFPSRPFPILAFASSRNRVFWFPLATPGDQRVSNWGVRGVRSPLRCTASCRLQYCHKRQ